MPRPRATIWVLTVLMMANTIHATTTPTFQAISADTTHNQHHNQHHTWHNHNLKHSHNHNHNSHNTTKTTLPNINRQHKIHTDSNHQVITAFLLFQNGFWNTDRYTDRWSIYSDNWLETIFSHSQASYLYQGLQMVSVIVSTKFKKNTFRIIFYLL